VIRRVTAAALVVLVQFGAVAAPMLHVHVEDHDTPHHHGQALHAHLSEHRGPSHSASGPVIDHDDAGRTLTPQIFVSAAVDPFHVPALPAPCVILIVPAPIAVGRTPHVSHAHDPPCVPSLPSRAPPAFLS
jgi:hypothetical protein